MYVYVTVMPDYHSDAFYVTFLQTLNAVGLEEYFHNFIKVI